MLQFTGAGVLYLPSRLIPAGGTIIFNAKIATGTPSNATMAAYSQNNDSTQDRMFTIRLDGVGTFIGQTATPASGGKPVYPTQSSVVGTSDWMLHSINSAQDTQRFAVGAGAIASDVSASTVSSHVHFAVGGAAYMNGATLTPTYLLSGTAGEVAIYSTQVSQADFDALRAGTKKPEDIAGCIHLFTLLDMATGRVCKIDGTTTLTVLGSGISNSADPHPVNRAVPTTTIACTAGNASAASPNATITQSGLTTITCAAGAASAACPIAAVATKLMSDFIINNTGTRRTNQAVSYSWFPGGRIGSFVGITPLEGTGTTDATGRFAPGINRATGLLLTCVRNADATVDDVYYEAFA